MTGIIFTLTSVLLIHLVFTAQYHWPLAPLNCVLQMSAVTTLLVSQIASLKLILSNAAVESSQWPYMLNYIAVGIPPEVDNSQWSTAGLAAWLLMNATTSGLIQVRISYHIISYHKIEKKHARARARKREKEILTS